MKHEDSLSREEQIRLHIAGVTVRHKSPFDALPTPRNEEPLPSEVREKLVEPFHRKTMPQMGAGFAKLCSKAPPKFALRLLGEFDWRPRTVGARIIAVRRFFEFQEPMSNLFLKSEVCYVGQSYCHALAALNNEAAVETLREYLSYYLTRLDLGFDQGMAMAALGYLDEANRTSHLTPFIEPWHRFTRGREHWTRDNSYSDWFRQSMAAVERVRYAAST